MTPKQRVERYPNLQEGIDLETLLAIELLAKKDGHEGLSQTIAQSAPART
jgi:hypothetical protein